MPYIDYRIWISYDSRKNWLWKAWLWRNSNLQPLVRQCTSHWLWWLCTMAHWLCLATGQVISLKPSNCCIWARCRDKITVPLKFKLSVASARVGGFSTLSRSGKLLPNRLLLVSYRIWISYDSRKNWLWTWKAWSWRLSDSARLISSDGFVQWIAASVWPLVGLSRSSPAIYPHPLVGSSCPPECARICGRLEYLMAICMYLVVIYLLTYLTGCTDAFAWPFSTACRFPLVPFHWLGYMVRKRSTWILLWKQRKGSCFKLFSCQIRRDLVRTVWRCVHVYSLRPKSHSRSRCAGK